MQLTERQGLEKNMETSGKIQKTLSHMMLDRLWHPRPPKFSWELSNIVPGHNPAQCIFVSFGLDHVNHAYAIVNL